MLTFENIFAIIVFIVCIISIIRYIFILKNIEEKIKENKGGQDNVIRK